MSRVVWCALGYERLELAPMLAAVKNEALGGVVTFCGDVRSQTDGERTTRLFYETYEQMALEQMGSIAEQAAQRFEANVAVAHRLGEILPGETAVICIAACAHRAQAFECCRFLIDQIKADVPIWKKDL